MEGINGDFDRAAPALEGIGTSDDQPAAFEQNYIRMICELVSRLFSQMSRIGENDRKDISELKRKYHSSTSQSAGLERKVGNTTARTAAIGFGAVLISAMTPHLDDKKILQFIGEQFPNAVGSLYTGGYRADQTQIQAIKEMANLDLQKKGEKTGSEANAKQEASALLNAAWESQKTASR